MLDIDAKRLARGVRQGPAESALEAPFAGIADTELYPDLADKSAILCSRLVRNHPFPDGNKRIAYFAMCELLARSGVTWSPPGQKEVAEMVERLAAGGVAEEEFRTWVASHVTKA